MWKVFTLQRFSVSETDSWQVLKNILYYLWFSKPPKRHLPKAWINQLPNRDEHSNYQIEDNKLYKISSIWQTGEQLLKYLLQGNVHFDSKLFIIFLIPRFWTQGIFFWNDEVWEDWVTKNIWNTLPRDNLRLFRDKLFQFKLKEPKRLMFPVRFIF